MRFRGEQSIKITVVSIGMTHHRCDRKELVETRSIAKSITVAVAIAIAVAGDGGCPIEIAIAISIVGVHSQHQLNLVL